jgi:hypothetical protein
VVGKCATPRAKAALGGDFAEWIDAQHAHELALGVDLLPHALDDDQHVDAGLPHHQVRADLPDADVLAVDGHFGNEAVLVRNQLGDEFRTVRFDDVAEQGVFFADHDTSLSMIRVKL